MTIGDRTEVRSFVEDANTRVVGTECPELPSSDTAAGLERERYTRNIYSVLHL